MAEKDIESSKTFLAFLQAAVETYKVDLLPFSIDAAAPYKLVGTDALSKLWETSGVEVIKGTALEAEVKAGIEKRGLLSGTQAEKEAEIARSIPLYRAQGNITEQLPFSVLNSGELSVIAQLQVSVFESDPKFLSLRGVKATVYTEPAVGDEASKVFVSYDKQKVEAYEENR